MTEEEFTALAARRAEGTLTRRDESLYQEALSANPEWAASITGADDIGAEADALGQEGVDAVRADVADAAEDAATATEDAVGAAVDSSAADSAADVAETGTEAATESETAVAATVTDAPARARKSIKELLSDKLVLLGAAVVALIVIGLIIWGISSMAGSAASNAEPVAPTAVLEQISESDDATRADGTFEDGGLVTLYSSASENVAVLVTATLAPQTGDSAYVVWVTSGDKTVQAGTFTGASGDTTVALTAPVASGDEVFVTIEKLTEDKAPEKPSGDALTTITLK